MPSYLSYKRFISVLDEGDDIVGWFTTKTGVHIPLRKGQTKEEATKSFFENKPRSFTVEQRVPWYRSEKSDSWRNKREEIRKRQHDIFSSELYKKADAEARQLRDKWNEAIKPKNYEELERIENNKRDWEKTDPIMEKYFKASAKNTDKAREEMNKKYNNVIKNYSDALSEEFELSKQKDLAEEEYYEEETKRIKQEMEKFGDSYGKYYKFENGNEIFKSPSISYENGMISAIGLMGKESDRTDLESFGSGNILELTKEQAMSEWAKGAKHGDTFGGLSGREERALQLYSHFTPQNVALRKGEESPHDTAIIKDIINRTYNSDQGYLFRGVPATEEFKNLKVGDNYSDKAFMSTSPSAFVAKKFGGTDNYILQIKPAIGFGKAIGIGWLSEKPDEDEVVLQAGSNFKVVGVDHKKRLIKLEQL